MGLENSWMRNGWIREKVGKAGFEISWIRKRLDSKHGLEDSWMRKE